MIKYWIWFELQLENLTEEEKALLSKKLSKFPLIAFYHLNKRIRNFDTKYHWSIKPNVVLFLTIACAFFWITVLIYFLWFLK